MIHVGMTAGLRVSELIGLRPADVSFESQYLNLHVGGKGRKNRLLTLGRPVSDQAGGLRPRDGPYRSGHADTAILEDPEVIEKILMHLDAKAGQPHDPMKPHGRAPPQMNLSDRHAPYRFHLGHDAGKSIATTAVAGRMIE